MSQTLPERRSGVEPERWGPFGELEQMTERMRRLLDQTFGGAGWGPTAQLGGWSPAVDIEEQDDSYVVEADLPGVKRDDVNIELIGNELAITGQSQEREHQGELRRQTRRTGRFAYRLTLPDQVDPEKVEASLADGVLTVRVPKSERAQRRKIELKS